ncbi:MAG: 4Fe-4S dicluster domain-containing protein [Candidatus Rokubacteria bacterium]|nr:4Fe-4S dicluster domain-containing protein [Candidatus Rokubacteria bacterium]
MTEWLEGLLRAGTRVIAPVEEDGLRRFRAVESAAEVCLATGKTRWSPKEFFFPRTESLFAYSVDGSEVRLEGAALEEREQVLFGVRPCDAAGLTRLDAIFLKGEVDPLYASRRERSAVVSLACAEAEPECFCTAVGGSPAGTEGSDVRVIAVGEAWLVEPLTPKGEALTAPLRDRAAAPPEEWARAEAHVQGVEAGLRQNPVAREWASVLERSFDLPLWQALGRQCLGCSICTYVCPSCSCFDVQDTGNARCGDRCRSWDSCTFALFTRHASGHNPRPTQAARYRQRVLHKFAYFPLENDGRFMCVGCGRCVKLCPVGMSIQDSVQRVVTAAREK